MNEAYWAKHPEGPFATLIRVASTYCHPEQDADAYDDLKFLARQQDDAEMSVFKAVDYGDGSDEKFLRRLWRDLYGDEPIASS